MTSPDLQHFTSETHGVVAFLDRRQTECVTPAEPRDITIVPKFSKVVQKELKTEIAVDIRSNQGVKDFNLRRNLKYGGKASGKS